MLNTKRHIRKIRWQTTQRVALWLLSFIVTASFSLGFLPFEFLDKNEEGLSRIEKFIQKAKADELTSVYVESIGLSTTTSRVTYTTKLNVTSGNFTGGNKYFIYFNMGLGASTATGRVNYQISYGGSVQYTGTVEPVASTVNNATEVSWIDVYTQPSTPVAITVGFKCNDNSMIAGASNATFVAMDLDEKMINEYDYYYNENTTSGAHSTTYTSKASITLNNADGLKDWLIFGMEDLQVDSATINAEARLFNGTGGSLARSQEGEDNAELFTFVLIRTYNNLVRGVTMSIQVRDDTTGANDHIKSRIFAFDLNVFNSHDSIWATSLTNINASWTQLSTLSYTPATAGNQVIFVSYLNDVAAANTQSNDRLQVTGTTVPTSWDWTTAGGGKTSYDTTDITQSNIQAIVYMNASTYSLDLDAIEITGASQQAKGRSITAFSTLYNHMPQIKTWRWYADEEDATPGTAYEAEDTAPPQAEMGKSIAMKLRITIDEVGGQAENNNRKKIYYSTGSTGPWTEVGRTVDTLFAWRYYDGDTGGANDGDDNTVLDATVLSGSPSAGIYNKSNSTGPSNSDHAANAIVEHEFSIENYNATANTTYYFAFFDEDLGLIPPATGSSLPNLTTASAYDLSIIVPSFVDLGSWQLGDGDYSTYTFTGPTEIVAPRDNRGQTAGDSSGWSLAADMSTELYFPTAPGYCGSVAFTGSGVDDMTIDFCENTLSAQTDYKIVILDTPGPDLFEWYKDGGGFPEGMGECLTIPVWIEENIFIIFGAETGHTIGDYWEFTAYPATNTTITRNNNYWITNTISGKYDAPTTGISGNAGEYMSSAVTAASSTASGKNGLGGFDFQPTLRTYNASVAGEYTGVLTFTLT